MKKMIASMILSAVAVTGLFAAANAGKSTDTAKPTTTSAKKTHKKHAKSTTAKTTAPAPAAAQ